MQNEDTALVFFDSLERAENALLAWGVVDSFFAEEELVERADNFLDALPPSSRSYDTGSDLVSALLDAHLLWEIPGKAGRYRTRMAETVRLFTRLRQIFSNAAADAWRLAPGLVADYRLIIRPRLFPLRDIPAADLLAYLSESGLALQQVQLNVLKTFLQVGTAGERKAAAFQMRATARILRMSGEPNVSGTVVSAGTGSGKTLAFYLPAYAAMAPLMNKSVFWTKCLALYPRNELLKDQLREALVAARKISATLLNSGKRRLIVAALYGATPNDPNRVKTGDNQWDKLTVKGQPAFECPYIRCPECGSKMGWLDKDVNREEERLVCANSACSASVESDEIRLTRKRMQKEPPDVLFTSTEMMNQRMSDSKFRQLFGCELQTDRRPMFILVDEVHSYEGVHGAHVALLLRRWARASEAKPHYVGLSATLADAPRFFAELVGLLPGYVAEVTPAADEMKGQDAEYLLALRGDPSSGTSLLSTTIQALMLLRRSLAPAPSNEFGTKVFAFTDNLDVTNRLYHNLLDAEGWTSSGRPNPARPDGSLANIRSDSRPQAGPRLPEGQNWRLVEDIGHSLLSGSRARVGRTSSQDLGVDSSAEIIVATSALEVGFDDPEVGAVLQHKAPQSTSAYLQRKGRAGRKQGMRPWTVVVLSDFGRDRLAFQNYDRLFSPVISPRYLPLSNRAILKMQGTFALFDWLARRIPKSKFPNPWSDFSQPSSEVVPDSFAQMAGERAVLYASHLQSLLTDSYTRDDFARFLGRSLAITAEQVDVILWDPPRSIMMEAIPTLLRRLETAWSTTSPTIVEPHQRHSPLPEFVPKTLFSDLQLPEVTILLGGVGQAQGRTETMPIAAALREFAPGRVSRRFGVSHGHEKYWISNGSNPETPIDVFCSAKDRQELGLFRFTDADSGVIQEVLTFRPTALNVTRTEAQVQQSSNSFLTWRTEILPTDQGHSLELPSSRRWAGILKGIEVHTHSLGLPLEQRRFTTGFIATVGRGRQEAQTTKHVFSFTNPSGDDRPGALGFAADVDGLRFRFAYPADLAESVSADDSLVRSLRVARFRDVLKHNSTLALFANSFQCDWLGQIFISAITISALRRTISIQEVVEETQSETLTSVLQEVVSTIMQSAAHESDDPTEAGDDGTQDERSPKRLTELLALLGDPTVRKVHLDSATVLWEPLDSTWENWLRSRFKATLGTAVLEAACALNTSAEQGSLVLTVDALVNPPPEPLGVAEDEFWLTESTIGGGGIVEDFTRLYAENPRHFLRLLDSKLAPSDLENASEDLHRILSVATSGQGKSNLLATAFDGIRSASNHAESVSSGKMLKEALTANSFSPTTTLLVSINTRLLHPGTSAKTDAFVREVKDEWQAAENALGIEIDVRVFALVKSSAPNLLSALDLENYAASASASWRYSILYGLLWPSGSQLRTEGLRAYSQFESFVDCDRLIVGTALTQSVRRISVNIDGWFTDFSSHIVSDGEVELVAEDGATDKLRDALLRVATDPVDSEALLIHARLTGVRQEKKALIASFELPEAFQ